MDLNNLRFAPQMFRYLNGGHFICASARNEDQKKWFDALEAGWEDYAEAWRKTTGFELARGDGYYYFRKKITGDNRSFEKVAADYRDYCTMVDLLYRLDQSFCVGKVVTKSWALQCLEANPAAQETSRALFKGTTKNDWADELIEQLRKYEIVDSFMNEEQYEIYYPVTEAFDYYRTFIETIQFSSKEVEKSVEVSPDEPPSLFEESDPAEE